VSTPLTPPSDPWLPAELWDAANLATHPIEAKGQDGTVMFDGHGVTVARLGWVARQQHGRGGEWFPLAGLASVAYVPATLLRRGRIELRDSGGKAASVVFLSGQAGPFNELCTAVQRAIAERDAAAR
jgi:hypothetical protein